MDAEQMAIEMMGGVCQLIRGPIQHIQDLSKGGMGVLGYLLLRDGAATPTELSRELGVSTARITNVLNGLERKGYIVRSPSPGDRRMVLASITEEGRRRADQCGKMATANLAVIMEALGEEDARTCIRLVGRILEICREKPELLEYPGPAANTQA